MKNHLEELQVAALQNGTVIDHIPTDKLFTIVSLLDHLFQNLYLLHNLFLHLKNQLYIIKCLYMLLYMHLVLKV